MKKILLFISAIPLLFLFACDDFSNLEMPESLSIKTAAKFAVPLGNGDIQIRKKASIEEVQRVLDDNINKSSSASSTQLKPVVYEYNPADASGNVDNSAVMQYIINYPIKEIPLNSLKASNGKDLDTKSLENIEITGTNFSLNDFIDTINDSMSNIMKIDEKKFPIPELGVNLSLDDAVAQAGIGAPGFSFTVTEPAFSSMKFESGKINITIKSPDTVSNDFSVTLKLILVDAVTKDVENPIATSEQKTVTGPNATGTLTMNLANASIVNEMYVVISGSISGGATPSPAIKQNEYTFEMKADTSSSGKLKLAEIRGLKMSNAELADFGAGTISISENFDVKLDKSFVSATIKEGNMQFYCKYPDVAEGEEAKLTGINCDEAVFSLSGGMAKSDGSPLDDFVDKGGIGYIVNKELDLAGAMISKNVDTDSDGKEDTCRVSTTGSYIKPSLNNATIIFPKTGETLELTLGGVCSVKKIGEIKFNLGELNNFEETIDTGLNMATLLSDVMKGDSKNLIDDIKFSGIEGYIFITQPTNNANLQGISVAGTVEAIYKKDGTTKSIFIVENASAPGTKATMNMKKTQEITALVDGTQKTVQSVFSALAGDSNVIMTDKLFIHEDDDCSGSSHLHSFKVADGTFDKLINDCPEDLTIHYDMGLTVPGGEITLADADLSKLSSDASVSVSLALVVPLTINLEDNADIPYETPSTDGVITIEDVLSLAKTEEEQKDSYKDLLDRSEDEDSDFLKYADALKSAYISYNVTNELIKNLEEYYTDAGTVVHPKGEDLALKLTLYTVNEYGVATQIFDENEDGACEKEIPVADGLQRLELSKNEVKKLLSKEGNPFIPKIRAEIIVPKNDSDVSQLQYIPRNGEFAVSGTLHIEFDENIPVEVWSK